MNPSTGDILARIDRVGARNVFVFPNNKNIVLACNQARDLTKDKTVIVIPSLTVPQGIAGMMSYLGDDSDVEAVKEAMYEAISSIKSFSLTYSIRDTEIDGYNIKKGNVMALSDRGLEAVSDNLLKALKELFDRNIDASVSYVTFYRGSDIDEEQEKEVENMISEHYPDIDVSFNYGGQPIYYYIISME